MRHGMVRHKLAPSLLREANLKSNPQKRGLRPFFIDAKGAKSRLDNIDKDK